MPRKNKEDPRLQEMIGWRLLHNESRGVPTPDNPKNKRNPRSHDGGSRLSRRNSNELDDEFDDDEFRTRGVPTLDNPKNKRNPRSHDGGSRLNGQNANRSSRPRNGRGRNRR